MNHAPTNRTQRRRAAREFGRKAPATPPQPATAAAASTSTTWSWANLAPLLIVMLVMAVYRFMVMDQPGPPGSDPGNWLAFSHQLLGSRVKAADSMYFPVMLVMLKAALVFLQPLAAAKAVGVLCSISIAVPFYLLLRRACSRFLAAALCLALLMTGYQTEMLSWGGYPQLLATSFMLGAMMLLDDGLLSGKRSTLVWAGALVALVAGTHHFTLAIIVVALALYTPWAVMRQRHELGVFVKRYATFVAWGVGLSLLFLPWYIWYLQILAGGGSLHANEAALPHLTDVFNFVYAEAPLTWMLLMLGAPLLSLLPFGNRSAWRIAPLGVALAAGSFLLYLPTHEVRVFQPLQVGVLLCLGAFGARVESYIERLRASTLTFSVGALTYGMAVASLALIFAINGNTHFKGAVKRYTAMDSQAVEAMDWLKQNTPPGTRVLAGGRGGATNYSWWLEGYAQRPSYGAINKAFLSFKQEQVQADQVAQLDDPDASVSQINTLLAQTGIRYVFIYKNSDGEFQHLADTIPYHISYQNDEFLVLKLSQDQAAARPQP